MLIKIDPFTAIPLSAIIKISGLCDAVLGGEITLVNGENIEVSGDIIKDLLDQADLDSIELDRQARLIGLR